MDNLQLLRVKQTFENKKIEDIPKVISRELSAVGLDNLIKPGMKIGITVGSRGISNIKSIIKRIIHEVKEKKGLPFIIPAMGSHGGATADGQRNILKEYGITEESMQVPVKATMDVVELGTLKNGLRVYFDKIAFEADGIIAVNRIKVHTGFKSHVESGLHKILAVGLGNHKGAELVHSLGVEGLRNYMIEFAKMIIEKAPLLCGIGILENAKDETYRISAALPEDFEKTDSELLKECKRILPTLPEKEIDILIVQEMGKNISGTGMDTNIVGGIIASPGDDYSPPSIKRLLVFDLTDESNGNALGIGRADLITKKMYDKIDLDTTYTNVITSTFLDRGKIPVVAGSEKEAFEIATKTLWNLPGTVPRVVIIRNTLKLDELYVSQPVWEEIKTKPNIIAAGEWEKLTTTDQGDFKLRI